MEKVQGTGAAVAILPLRVRKLVGFIHERSLGGSAFLCRGACEPGFGPPPPPPPPFPSHQTPRVLSAGLPSRRQKRQCLLSSNHLEERSRATPFSPFFGHMISTLWWEGGIRGAPIWAGSLLVLESIPFRLRGFRSKQRSGR